MKSAPAAIETPSSVACRERTPPLNPAGRGEWGGRLEMNARYAATVKENGQSFSDFGQMQPTPFEVATSLGSQSAASEG